MCVRIGGVDATVRAPASVLTVLSKTLLHAGRSDDGASIRATIDVERDERVWRISGHSERSLKVLSADSALPQVGGAVVASLVADAAECAGLAVWRAAVVEREGRAVAFVGDDWESGVVLATHLHARGWRLLGGDYALVHRDGMNVLATRKMLYIT